MFCPKCGKELSNQASFCAYCGTKLEVSEDNKLASIVVKIKNGDRDAFNDFYFETQKYVRYVAVRKGMSQDLAEDVVQEVYATIFQKISTLNDPNAAWGWVKVIANNTAVDMGRKESRYMLLDEETEESVFGNLEEEDECLLPEDAMDNQETQRMIRDIIDSLPVMQKVVILNYYYDNKKINTIADEMNLSPGTVKSYLSKGRKKIEDGCLTIQKTTGVKLYAMPMAPMLYLVIRKSILETVVTQTAPAWLIGSQAGAAVVKTAAVKTGTAAAKTGTATKAGTTAAKTGSAAAKTGSAAKAGTTAAKTGAAAAKAVAVKTAAGLVTAAVVGTGTVAYVTHDKREIRQTIEEFENACRYADEEELKDCFSSDGAALMEKHRIQLQDEKMDDLKLTAEEIRISGDKATALCTYSLPGERSVEGYLNLIYEDGDWKLVLNSVNEDGIRLYFTSSSVSCEDILENEFIYNDDDWL